MYLTVGLDQNTLAIVGRGVTIPSCGPDDFIDYLHSAPDMYEGLVIDLDFADLGLRFCRELRRKAILHPVIGLLASGVDVAWSELRAEFLENGGDDLLKTPVNPRELVAAMNALTRRNKGQVSGIVSVQHRGHKVKLDDFAKVVTVNGRILYMTPQEASVLGVLFRYKGRVVSKEQIYNELYTLSNEEPEIKIVDVWVHKVRKKLSQVEPELADLITTSWGRGYMLEGSLG